MEIPEPVIVDWPSLLFALIVDSLLVWGPAVSAFYLVPVHQGPIALTVVLVALIANWALYARGTTLGTQLGGFRLQTRRREAPGRSYGLVLALLTFAPVLALGLLLTVSLVAGNNASGFLGRPQSLPIVGVRIRPRRFLQAVDDYWERWAD
ncbi:hypothetical protein ACFVTE_18775 [Arthrobacter sp. NPDC058097]|uniref:hypothetical protein n=1 Tax=Arthrobacter sp. NPDC058097 TaxID=3346340 RepID=UPI0036D80123